MQPERLHEQRLRALDLWRGPVDLEPLPGGITNRNYRVRDQAAGTTVVARICEERPHLGIDRRSEAACQRAAHALGVAPAVVHHEDGVLLSDHLEARTLTPADVRDPALLPRLAAVLRRLHEGWDRIAGLILYFSPFQAVRTYAQTARELGAELPTDLDDLLEDARGLARRLAPFTPVLCHNDLLAANWLDEPSSRLWLVDWEYAGVGHPLFDLANVASNADLEPEAEAALLRAYREAPPDPRELAELRVLRTVSSLREALWSVIQTVASDLDFDYRSYAHQNLDAYREARARLGPAG